MGRSGKRQVGVWDGCQPSKNRVKTPSLNNLSYYKWSAITSSHERGEMACKQVKHFAAIAEWCEMSVDCQAKRVSVNKGSHEQQEISVV